VCCRTGWSRPDVSHAYINMSISRLSSTRHAPSQLGAQHQNLKAVLSDASHADRGESRNQI